MKRIAVVVVLLVAGAALADIAPPKGLKRVPVENKIETEKEYPEYSFFAVSFEKVTPVKIDPKTPAVVTAGGGKYRFAYLVAVPKDAGKGYASETEYHKAVADMKVTGQVKSKTIFPAFTEVKDSDPRKVVVMKYKLEKIDAKDGIVLTQLKDEPKPGKEEEEEAVSPTQPASQWLALGFALSAAFAGAGLWLARRRSVRNVA